jgi:hexosaminidase
VEGQTSPEAYQLSIRADSGIAIVGNSAAGVAYGLQTLRDLLPLPGAKPLALNELTIVDAPRFGYRGFQLDVARNFHGKQTVFKWLDLMARYKLNKFHFHLTDDEGWRLEIAGLPELTSIGAVRGHSAKPGVRLQPAYGSGPDPKRPQRQRLFQPRRLHRDPALCTGAPHRGDPGNRDAGPRARRRAGDGSALPAHEGGGKKDAASTC